MWRYLAGGLGVLSLAAGGVMLANSGGKPAKLLPDLPKAFAQSGAADSDLGALLPEATDKTREEKRFGRYDKDRDGAITRNEYLASRRKAYARLDSNGDGTLSFDEWATKTNTRFATADGNRDGRMNPTEFATTAPKRRARPTAPCPPAEGVSAGEAES